MTKNTEPYLSTYFHAKGQQRGAPVAGNFELTARCNFHCPMCYVHMTQEQVDAAGSELSAQQWISLAEQARDRGMLFALLTGGEPLVRKDFFEIYQGMKALGLLVSVNTNGSMLQGEILERFLQDPPSRFNISLYGGSNTTYQRMCGCGVYDRVKENIRLLRKAGVDVSLNLSITAYNRDDLAQIYADAQELNVNVRASSYMYPPIRLGGEYGCSDRLSAEDAARCGVEWDRLRFSPEEFSLRGENMAKLIDQEQEKCPIGCGEGISCRAGVTSFWVTWDGRMLPCGMMTTPEFYPMEVGFDRAWEQLKQATAAIRLPEKCTSCRYKQICNACAAVCYTETGRFDAVPTYACEKARQTVRWTAEALAKRRNYED